VSFQVRAGEIVGLAGLVGAGRSEIARAVFGVDPYDAGTVTLNGKPVSPHDPRAAIRAGMAFVPEDRRQQGLVLHGSVGKNIASVIRGSLDRAGFLTSRAEYAAARPWAARLEVKTNALDMSAATMSGGNQQKLVIAKWLRRGSKVFLFDEPTKGVDVGGKAEIYGLIDQLAAAGNAIVVVSSDLPEIISLSDRVLVMRNGRFTSEHVGDDINEHSLVANAMGIAERTTT
jgi:rhamnose transport system ATP-binding protein